MIVTFSVPFVLGKQRPRFFKRGRHTGTFTPEQTKDAMRKIANAYRGESIRRNGYVAMAPRDVPVTVAITTIRPLPKSRPKRMFREYDTFTPDADNAAKLVLDGLNGVAWDDDKQITQLHVRKFDRIRDMPERTHVLVMWEER